MGKIGKLIFTVLVVFIFAIFFCFALFFYWYTGAVDVPVISESLRVKLDGYFLEKYNKRDPFTRFLHTTVFGNADKYVWEPPRPVPVYSRSSGDFSGYDVFGMVTSWEPEAYTLRVRSYNRQNLVVRLNPELDRSIAVIAPMDQYGYISSVNVMRIVSSTMDTFWPTLFCPSDIVAVSVSSKFNLSTSSNESPIIPKHVRLVRRLCGT